MTLHSSWFYVTFLYTVEKKLLIITLEKQEEILLTPITKPPRNFNVYSIIWRYFESLKDGVFYFMKMIIWAIASCNNSMMHVYLKSQLAISLFLYRFSQCEAFKGMKTCYSTNEVIYIVVYPS